MFKLNEINISEESKLKGIIYKITNTINGKVYIGQSVNSFRMRYNATFSGCCSEYIINSIKKYGSENFTVEILAKNQMIENLNYLEAYYISKWDLTNRKNGYNLRAGGFNSSLSEESKRKMSESRIGSIPWNKGIIGEYSHSYGLRGSDSYASKSVILKTIHGEIEFGAVIELADYLGVLPENLGSWISGRFAITSSIVEKFNILQIYEKGTENKSILGRSISDSLKKKVVLLCTEYKKHFDSIGDLENYLGVSRGVVGRWIKSRTIPQKYKGYIVAIWYDGEENKSHYKNEEPYNNNIKLAEIA